MGNEMGKANRLAIAAMANVTTFEKKELMTLCKKIRSLAEREGNPAIVGRKEFREAMDNVGIAESDSQILERLFTMLDKTGDEEINHVDFMVGIAPLITGDANEKLSFAIELYKEATSNVSENYQHGGLQSTELTSILVSMNNVASYFGDPVLSREQIDHLVDKIYHSSEQQQEEGEEEGGGGSRKHYLSKPSNEVVGSVVANQIFHQFLQGKGPVRYGGGGGG